MRLLQLRVPIEHPLVQQFRIAKAFNREQAAAA